MEVTQCSERVQVSKLISNIRSCQDEIRVLKAENQKLRARLNCSKNSSPGMNDSINKKFWSYAETVEPPFYSLIPKTNAPKNVVDFRPIILSNVSYKIIYKLLTNRLKSVIDKFASPFQAAFLSSRQITDNIVIAHEIVDTLRRHGSTSGLMALKLYMSKSFDIIECPFLMANHEHWCIMIEQDILSRMLIIAEDNNDIQGIKVINNASSVSHLYFEDDCLVFTKASDNAVKNNVVTILKIRRLGLQEKYLGVLLLIWRNKMETLGHIQSSFEKRLGMWKSKHVNQPGRTVLTHIVLGTLAMPKRLTDRLDSIQRKFFWNKKRNNRGLYFRGWDNVAKPIVHGGLNIKKTEYVNYSLLAKLSWRMLKEPD
ncbi:uncharacterized protein LOC113273064 [Papaver somniferum]|uniref:uncharacterized protein LOC113273064 n=1 Tax=Papaver somniferum TaxID=3469 RepID=UPI000E701915|nr:uncharacterized protein LOC113273064 [Papaver somniferum]